jgi:hypothetical protein
MFKLPLYKMENCFSIIINFIFLIPGSESFMISYLGFKCRKSLNYFIKLNI